MTQSIFISNILEQQKIAIERIKNKTSSTDIKIDKISIICDPKVCPPYFDSILLAKTASYNTSDIVLDCFSGTGVVGIIACQTAKKVIATDISSFAVQNIKRNITQHGLSKKMSARECDVFPITAEKFNVITLNPPYMDHTVEDLIERTAWDEDHSSIKLFFDQVRNYLIPGGTIFLAWANFSDFSFIEQLVTLSGFEFEIVRTAEEQQANFMNVQNIKYNKKIVYNIYKIC